MQCMPLELRSADLLEIGNRICQATRRCWPQGHMQIAQVTEDFGTQSTQELGLSAASLVVSEPEASTSASADGNEGL